MFYEIFYRKFKIDFLDTLDINDETKQKIASFIKDLKDRQNFYLRKLDSELKSSLVIFLVILLFLTLIKFSSFDVIKVNNLLNTYVIWVKTLPAYITIFLPSKIINSFWISYFWVTLISFIILACKTIIPIFQYRNDQRVEQNLFQIIFEDFFETDLTEISVLDDLSSLDTILKFPNHDIKQYTSQIHLGESDVSKAMAFMIDLYNYDTIASYRPKTNILSAVIIKNKLNFSCKSFKIKSDFKDVRIEYGDDLLTSEEEDKIVTCIKIYKSEVIRNNKAYNFKYLDDKIWNFFAKKPKYLSNNFEMQYILNNNELYCLVPKLRELFSKKSLFDFPVDKADINLLITILKLNQELIKIIKSYA